MVRTHSVKFLRRKFITDDGNTFHRLNRSTLVSMVHIALTHQCVLNCSICLNRNPLSVQINTTLVKHLLNEAYAAGTIKVVLSGGEPLLHKDFKEIFLYAKKKGFMVIVLTNGILLTQSWVSFFTKNPPFVLQVTFYGLRKKTYETVTRTRGSFQIFQKNIKRLRKSRLRLNLVATFCKDNQTDIDEFMSLPVKPWETLTGTFSLLGRTDGNKELTAVIAKKRLDTETVGDCHYRYRTRPVKFPPLKIDKKIAQKPFFRCMRETNNDFFMTPHGKCALCFDSTLPAISRQYIPGMFTTLVKDMLLTRKKEPKLENIRCISCKNLAYCFWCPQFMNTWHGITNTHDPYRCDVTNTFSGLAMKESNKKTISNFNPKIFL